MEKLFDQRGWIVALVDLDAETQQVPLGQIDSHLSRYDRRGPRRNALAGQNIVGGKLDLVEHLDLGVGIDARVFFDKPLGHPGRRFGQFAGGNSPVQLGENIAGRFQHLARGGPPVKIFRPRATLAGKHRTDGGGLGQFLRVCLPGRDGLGGKIGGPAGHAGRLRRHVVQCAEHLAGHPAPATAQDGALDAVVGHALERGPHRPVGKGHQAGACSHNPAHHVGDVVAVADLVPVVLGPGHRVVGQRLEQAVGVVHAGLSPHVIGGLGQHVHEMAGRFQRQAHGVVANILGSVPRLGDQPGERVVVRVHHRGRPQGGGLIGLGRLGKLRRGLDSVGQLEPGVGCRVFRLQPGDGLVGRVVAQMLDGLAAHIRYAIIVRVDDGNGGHRLAPCFCRASINIWIWAARSSSPMAFWTMLYLML